MRTSTLLLLAAAGTAAALPIGLKTNRHGESQGRVTAIMNGPSNVSAMAGVRDDSALIYVSNLSNNHIGYRETNSLIAKEEGVTYNKAEAILDALASGKSVSDEDLRPFLKPQNALQGGNILHLIIQNLFKSRRGVFLDVQNILSIIGKVGRAILKNNISPLLPNKHGHSPLEYLLHRVLGSITTDPLPFEHVKPIFDCIVKLTPVGDENLKTTMQNIYDEAAKSNEKGDKQALMDYANQFIQQ
jgi:hypothetical protein